MAIVDAKGRLFGKVSVLDLAVVLAVVAVGARFGYKAYEGSKVAPTGELKTVTVVMKVAAVAQPTLDYVSVGDTVSDSKSNQPMGKVVSIRSEPARVVATSEDGRIYEHLSQDRFDFYVTVTGDGRVSSNQVNLGDFEMKIGRTNYVKTPLWAGYGITWDLKCQSKGGADGPSKCTTPG